MEQGRKLARWVYALVDPSLGPLDWSQAKGPLAQISTDVLWYLTQARLAEAGRLRGRH